MGLQRRLSIHSVRDTVLHFRPPANGPLISGQSAADLLGLLVHTVRSSNFAVQILA